MNESVVDPVCGMIIDPATAVASSTFDGARYHFCARSCEAKFNAAPQQYATPEPAASCCATGHSCC